ncbi:hypothetical protein SERLA73DRAFT_160864 [Serpula lacrymans var. lacrymans S7.3]|uniref:RNase H type-1 domain-containing protein n=1 Tax=Serpula lacrymans var. lacrymans (strain S7.3) TaxID=936435 RepID=F8Q0F8_SERL3|nr:hypothetical protein SERLA73DRAFT_160864 [Serpula lacrymans var. lacrymans S7.3]
MATVALAGLLRAMAINTHFRSPPFQHVLHTIYRRSVHTSDIAAQIARNAKGDITDGTSAQEKIKIYADGSGIGGGIGAAAVMLRSGRKAQVLRYYLGSAQDHTAHDGEMAGMLLATELALRAKVEVRGRGVAISINVDDQQVMRDLESFESQGGKYTSDTLRIALRRIRRNSDIVVRWVPGHAGVDGNVRADKEAKKAARGHFSHDLPDFMRPKESQK